MKNESTLTHAATNAAAQAVHGRTLRAVEYLRVSTEEQKKGYGVASQGKKTAGFIAARKWNCVGRYVDEGFSGSLEMRDRPDLKRLMGDAEKGLFDVVVVKEGRAIGRTGRAFWRWVWALEDMGIFVAIASSGTDNTTTPGRKEMRRQADYAEEEWETIRDRTQDGLQEKAEEGGWIGGQPPYGYRIHLKGEKKLSHLVIDKKEAIVLRRSWELIVKEGKNLRQTALWLNIHGMHARSGKQWTGKNLRERLLSDAAAMAQSVFRHPGRAWRDGKNSSHTKLGKDGRPRFGETVVIPLDPIFLPSEIELLRSALDRFAKRSAAARAAYPLSGRIVNPCGKHAIGFRREGERGGRWYRCSGKEEKYAGAARCTCPYYDADSMEKAVWSRVVDFLSDPAEVEAMAQEWKTSGQTSREDHATRIAEFADQIAAQESAISAVMSVAAKEAVKAGKSGPEVENAVTAAVKPMSEELAQLKILKQNAVEWQLETQQVEERGARLQELAERADQRLRFCGSGEQAEYLALLEVTVKVAGPPPKQRQGRPCALARWFRENGRAVPSQLSDAAWERIQPLMPGKARSLPYRDLIDGILYKARTGVRWCDLPERFGNGETIHTRCAHWLKSGFWGRIMEELKNEPSEPLAEMPPPVPPMHITGGVDPRLFAAHEVPRSDTAANTESPRT